MKIILKIFIVLFVIVFVLIVSSVVYVHFIREYPWYAQPPRLQLPEEMDSIDNNIVNKYKLPSFGIMNEREDYRCILEKDIKDCKKKKLTKKLIFCVYIMRIQNKKYFNEKLMEHEADSLYVLINKYLPNKDCIDSIYIMISATDSTKTADTNIIYDKTLKYPVKNNGFYD